MKIRVTTSHIPLTPHLTAFKVRPDNVVDKINLIAVKQLISYVQRRKKNLNKNAHVFKIDVDAIYFLYFKLMHQPQNVYNYNLKK